MVDCSIYDSEDSNHKPQTSLMPTILSILLLLVVGGDDDVALLVVWLALVYLLFTNSSNSTTSNSSNHTLRNIIADEELLVLELELEVLPVDAACGWRRRTMIGVRNEG